MNDEPMNDDMLRDLQRRTAELPREIAPPHEAWDAIKAQIELDSASRGVSSIVRRPLWQRPSLLAAAAILLVAGASITTALLMNGRLKSSASATVARSDTVSTSGAPATLAEFTAVENDYISTANRLSAVIESGQADLAPETVVKLRESLRVIDAAILEARRALAADPANTALMEILSTSYSQKVDLLRRTAEMGRS
ncbi:MAG TPA: hypothetical protein VKO87_15200 [Gemmatimonadaceae bacterium]|nr:hypothetical protein [Gemmatimonadaceae bacterium]